MYKVLFNRWAQSPSALGLWEHKYFRRYWRKTRLRFQLGLWVKR